MRVLVLGGTGSIGAAVVQELVRGNHSVVALARSPRSARLVEEFGATALKGDLREPQLWVGAIADVDAVVHAASDFGNDMEAVDARLLDVLLPAFAKMPKRPRFLYTGGCWLYGATGERVATEASAFDPLLAFAWSVPTIQRLLDAAGVDTMIIHPAMVYSDDGGVIEDFVANARDKTPIHVVESEAVRWPLVHADDLAVLYRLVLERGVPGESYNGSAVDGLSVGSLVRAIAARFGAGEPAIEIVRADAVAAEKGDWAHGYALDQQMSGAKARQELGWSPVHLDPLTELARKRT